jgi:hypothetical protein
MPNVNRAQLREWAVTGAEQRLLEIAREAAAIHQAFPELRQGRAKSRAGSASRVTPARTRRRRNLSAAARKRISDAQKKRWAAVRRAAR